MFCIAHTAFHASILVVVWNPPIAMLLIESDSLGKLFSRFQNTLCICQFYSPCLQFGKDFCGNAPASNTMVHKHPLDFNNTWLIFSYCTTTHWKPIQIRHNDKPYLVQLGCKGCNGHEHLCLFR
ncbi:MAG: hypothetical protein H6Q14_2802 [Bacteroidetes bacterium]|nr:hypothetical protein [Bacteroidota bacterium]